MQTWRAYPGGFEAHPLPVRMAHAHAHILAQGVYDADLLSDPQLRALTMLHAVAFSTRTLDRFSEPGRYALEVRGERGSGSGRRLSPGAGSVARRQDTDVFCIGCPVQCTCLDNPVVLPPLAFKTPY